MGKVANEPHWYKVAQEDVHLGEELALNPVAFLLLHHPRKSEKPVIVLLPLNKKGG